jgi:phage terminase large subunit
VVGHRGRSQAVSATRNLEMDIAAVFAPLLEPHRYKGAYGGRGGGKSHFFANLLISDALAEPGVSGEGLRAVCIREVQKDLSQSAKLLIEDKLLRYSLGTADGFRVYDDCISTPRDGIIIFHGMNDYSAESIKSLENFKRAWIEEAHTISSTSLTLLRPTMRAPGSQILASWNRRRKKDPIDMLLCGAAPPTDCCVVKANWRDNPWFPSELEQERQDCMRIDPELYPHIWEGEYATAISGAYFARHILQAEREGRVIDNLFADPHMTIRAYWDIGGTGAKADACAIWIVQFINREIRVLAYYEAVGQELGFHMNWLRNNGYESALCVLPHDGATNDKVYAVSFESALRKAGFAVRVVKNQGPGAAKQRIEAAKKQFPKCIFHRENTQAGREALGWYHERKDEKRDVGLGPEHDWSSHGADAWGLMAIDYTEPSVVSKDAPRRLVKGVV